MPVPTIAVTPWRRTLPTWIHPQSDLYTLNPDYTAGVEEAGGLPLIVPHLTTREQAERVVAMVDGLMLTGGADIGPENYGAQNKASLGVDPGTDTNDLLLARAAIDAGVPVLAICRGAQIVNVAMGGTMHQHIWERSEHHPSVDHSVPDTTADRSGADRSGALAEICEATLAFRHPVELDAECRTATLFGATTVSTNSLHHQAIDAPGEGLAIVGRAPDGTPEVVEHLSAPVIGVQWHPERLRSEGHQVLFDWLIDQARLAAEQTS